MSLPLALLRCDEIILQRLKDAPLRDRWQRNIFNVFGQGYDRESGGLWYWLRMLLLKYKLGWIKFSFSGRSYLRWWLFAFWKQIYWWVSLVDNLNFWLGELVLKILHSCCREPKLINRHCWQLAGSFRLSFFCQRTSEVTGCHIKQPWGFNRLSQFFLQQINLFFRRWVKEI